MKAKSELKAALEALQVRKPLRLPSSAPTFAPPAQYAEAETLVPAQTLVATQTLVPVQTKVAQVSTGNQTEVTTSVPVRTMVDGGTKVPPKGTSHHVPEQDSAVVLEAQANPKLQNGYTRIPNALLIGRLTISYQRRFSPISKAVIERQTGLRGPAVLQALSELVAKGVIEKIPGDQNRPNQFGLVSAEEFFATPAGKASEVATPNTLVPTATTVLVQTMVPVGTPALVPAATSPLVPGGTYFKDNEIYKNINSLSEPPENLKKYFEQLKPAKKRESEWQAFEDLKTGHSAADIAECFSRIIERGISSGEGTVPCHSPMAFLSKAIGGVLTEVQIDREKIQRQSEHNASLRAKKQADQEQAEKDHQEWLVKDRAFERAFPGEERQDEAIAELCRGTTFRANSISGRSYAISAWWQNLSRYEKAEATE